MGGGKIERMGSEMEVAIDPSLRAGKGNEVGISIQ
jgi:hypothetical protein